MFWYILAILNISFVLWNHQRIFIIAKVSIPPDLRRFVHANNVWIFTDEYMDHSLYIWIAIIKRKLIILYYIILYYIILYYIILHCIALHCIALHCIALHSFDLVTSRIGRLSRLGYFWYCWCVEDLLPRVARTSINR